jgi:erythromycin esterase
LNLPPHRDVVAWLKANAVPLRTAEPGGTVDDLEFLRGIVGNRRIVSLGEATHGTHEFFQLKRRVIEFCVAQLGFTIIAFEDNYGSALAVNDYVLEGKGSATEVVKGLWVRFWKTEEVIALVEWVRAWNVAHERKVKFYGFDMQSGTAPARYLLGYLQRVAPDLAAASRRRWRRSFTTNGLV